VGKNLEKEISHYKEYSIREMVDKFSSHQLNNVVFHFSKEGKGAEDQAYFQIKLSKFVRKDKERIML